MFQNFDEFNFQRVEQRKLISIIKGVVYYAIRSGNGDNGSKWVLLPTEINNQHLQHSYTIFCYKFHAV